MRYFAVLALLFASSAGMVGCGVSSSVDETAHLDDLKELDRGTATHLIVLDIKIMTAEKLAFEVRKHNFYVRY